MKEQRFFYVPDAATAAALPADEATHAVRVLRLAAGDEVMLMDGCGNFYRAEITLAQGHRCFYAVREVLPQERPWPGRVHVAVAPTKMMERTEWMLEKSVEVGVDEVSFLDCRFSERRVVKLPRAEKIVVAAVKQSRKAWMPRLNGLMPFADFIRQPRGGRKFIAHCYDELPRTYLYDALRAMPADAEATVLVGPEGDFSVDEVRAAMACGYESVHLGRSRLRTETAGLAAVMMMQLSKT